MSPLPSGTMPTGSMFTYVRHVSDAEFTEASAALDRALLKAIGLPENLELHEFENTLYSLSSQIQNIVVDFTLAKLISILPGLVIEASALWDRVGPQVQTGTNRKEFVARVITYAYKKNDPDLPFLPEPFETVVEDMILAAIPGMLDNLEAKLNELAEKLKKYFS